MTAAVAIALSVAGGLCELAGLALVVLGIKRDRERARELIEAEPEPLPERTYPAPEITPTRPLASLGDYGGNAVTEKVSRLEMEVGNAFIKFKRLTDAEVDAMAQPPP